jgi:Holliday junction resolvasome RuvABC endonuclease subunit
MKTERILAIDPGTKTTGVAVLENDELLYYGVKTIRRPKSPQEVLLEAGRIVMNLIDFYQPTILAIEKPFLVQKSASLLIVLVEEMKVVGQRVGLRVFEYPPTFVRKRLCQSGRATKHETAVFVAQRYPELSRLLHRTSLFEQRYYSHVFDAVAVGIICSEEVEKAIPFGQGEMRLV